MRNIRLYIGGQRADLDSAITMPFNYQTTDSENPTAVKNSFSKTITLQGTESNRRLFGGLWHLDSIVQDPRPTPPPEYIQIATESDAEFTARNTPVIATGDRAKVTKVYGRTIVWNQCFLLNDYTASTTLWDIVVSNGVANATITNNNGSSAAALRVNFASLTKVAGHIYYIAYEASHTGTGSISLYTGFSSWTGDNNVAIPANTTVRSSFLVTCGSANAALQSAMFFYFNRGDTMPQNGDVITLGKFRCHDLTAMFGSGYEPTVAEFESLYPLDHYDYCAPVLRNNAASAISFRDAGNSEIGSFPLNVTGLECTSPNIWDEEWGQGTYLANGTIYSAEAYANAVRSESYIPCTSLQSYCLYCVNQSMSKWYVCEYDADKNFLQRKTINKGTLYTPSAGVSFFRWGTESDYGSPTFLNDISVIVSSAAYNWHYYPYGTFHPYADGAKSAGTAHDIIRQMDTDRVIGVMTSLDGVTPNSDAAGSNGYIRYNLNPTVPKKLGVTNIRSDKFVTKTSTVINNEAEMLISGNASYPYIYFSVKASELTGDLSTAAGRRTALYTWWSIYQPTIYYEQATPEHFTFMTPLSDTPVPSSPSGKQVRIPEDTASSVLAPFAGDFEYGYMKAAPVDRNVYFNPMKRVPFLLYVDEMVVERGYCQLVAINRKGRDYTFSVSLYGGLGEFFYNLQTSEDGEPKRLADLAWGADLGFTINKTFVQQNWDDLLGGTLPTIAFVPMHNGTPENIDAKKALIYGGGIPASITDGGTTYTRKAGYLLASLERKYTEWEMGDLRSYLQRPALRLKDFITAVCDPNNNGGWAVELDPAFFTATNPYYEKAYILLPQLNVEESTDDVCTDGEISPDSDYPSTVTRTTSLVPTSGGCLTIVSDEVDMSASASNAYLKLSLPVQLAVTGLSNYGNLYLTNRVSHHTENKTICMMAAAWDDDGNLIAVSNRYVFTSKSHRGETGDVKKPSAPYATSDAQIDGYFAWSGSEYVFRADDNPADTFALMIDKIPRPSSTLHKVRIDFYLQMTTDGIPTLNKYRYGDNSGNVNVSNTQFQARWLSNANNYLHLIEPTQYATDSEVTQKALLSSLECTPLDLLLSITKRYGLMWVQDNREKKVSLYARKNYYTGKVKDIHNLIDYSKGLKATPVSAESNNYVMEDKCPETTLSKAYESDWGRVYGGVRLKTGYDFGKEKVEMMDKSKLQGYLDGALSGSGYWEYANGGGKLPSAIADGMKVTYYYESGGNTDTKDAEYNLFNVASITKTNSPALGVASLNDGGEEEAVEVAPALVFFAGGQVPGTWHLTDDIAAMAVLNNGPCWLWDTSLPSARVPRFARVATFSGETYSLDYGTPRETYYIPEVSLAPEQAIYARFWESYLTDLLSRDTKKVECYVVFPPHLDMRQEMRHFYLFDRSLWVLNKITDYDPTKTQSVKCEFIRVLNKEAYRG